MKSMLIQKKKKMLKLLSIKQWNQMKSQKFKKNQKTVDYL